MSNSDSHSDEVPTDRLLRNVPLLYAVRLLFWTHFLSAVLVPFFRDWGGQNLSRILFLNAWFMAWNFLLEVPTGTVADRFGRKASVIAGLTAGTLAIALYVAAPSFELFLLAEIVAALGYTLLSGADEALLYDSLSASGRTEGSQRIFSRLESFKLGGIVLGALGGAALVGSFGPRGTVAWQILPMGLAIVVAFFLREPESKRPHEAQPTFGQILGEGVRHFKRTPALRRLTLDLVSVNAACWLVIWLYQPLLEAAGVGVRGYGVVHVLMTLGQILFLRQADRLEIRLGSRSRLLRLAALLPGLSFMALSVVGSPWAVVPLLILVAGFGLARSTLFAEAIHRQIPDAQRATVLSTVSMFRTLAIVLANGLGALAVAASLHGTAMGAGAAILLLAFLAASRPAELRPTPPATDD